MDAPFILFALHESGAEPLLCGRGSMSRGLVHAAHAGISGHRGFGFIDVAHHALGSQQHAGNAGSVVNISKKTKTTHVHFFIRDE